jgi:hypothetical protein
MEKANAIETLRWYFLEIEYRSIILRKWENELFYDKS